MAERESYARAEGMNNEILQVMKHSNWTIWRLDDLPVWRLDDLAIGYQISDVGRWMLDVGTLEHWNNGTMEQWNNGTRNLELTNKQCKTM